jgi:hypothetical protein
MDMVECVRVCAVHTFHFFHLVVLNSQFHRFRHILSRIRLYWRNRYIKRRYNAFKTKGFWYDNYTRSDPESKEAFTDEGGYLMSAIFGVLLGVGALFGLYRFDQWLTN